MSGVTTIDRTSMRQPPGGWPVMHQIWDKLLFLHWPVEAEALRPLIPAGLEIDTWEGTAWVSMTPFTMRGIRPPLMPSLPMISTSHELNVRTYVQRDGQPGVWFFSLDASNALAVWGARLGYGLPYFRASQEMEVEGRRIHFRSERTHAQAKPAKLHASWEVGPRMPEAAPDTLDFFLIERYSLYSESRGRLYQARIHHRPWPLGTAHIEWLCSNMLESHGLSQPRREPLVHAQAEPLPVRIWPPRRVA